LSGKFEFENNFLFAAPNNCDREHYYQQLFAASQLQYQQVLVTAVNQCYHLLWLQHQELANLRSTVHMVSVSTDFVAIKIDLFLLRCYFLMFFPRE